MDNNSGGLQTDIVSGGLQMESDSGGFRPTATVVGDTGGFRETTVVGQLRTIVMGIIRSSWVENDSG